MTGKYKYTVKSRRVQLILLILGQQTYIER